MREASSAATATLGRAARNAVRAQKKRRQRRAIVGWFDNGAEL
jgi:hypothetical protein